MTAQDTTREPLSREARLQVVARTLQNVGDQVVNAKTVLPWLLAAVGSPVWPLGLLVPIRESGSMLPQAAASPWVRRQRVRKWVWVVGAGGQALATAAMAVLAATASGVGAAIGLLAALAVFALARSLCSLAGKDVLGRTVPKGRRGRVTGTVTVFAGVVAIGLGVGLRLLAGKDVGTGLLAALLAAAALAWVLAMFVFAAVREPAAEVTDDAQENHWVAQSWALLAGDRPFRRFVIARTLLLVSALSPPFVVSLGATHGAPGLQGLGPFVIAQGVAALLGGRLFGRLADRSSRRLMMVGALAASVLVVVFLVLDALPAVRDQGLLYPIAYFLLALTHTGIRVARKTYVVDMAEGDRRTEYVAVSNTAMGVLLLVIGAVSGALASLSEPVALGFLAALGLVGVVVARALPEVEH